MKSNIYIGMVQFFLVALFTYTAVTKALNFENFQLTMKLVPVIDHYADLLSVLVPVAEAVTVVCLLTYRRLGLALSAVLMAAFTLYVAYVLYFSPNTPCSCGGIIKQLSWKQHLVFNSAATLSAILAGWLDRTIHPDNPGSEANKCAA
jgi:hypothetical protein